MRECLLKVLIFEDLTKTTTTRQQDAREEVDGPRVRVTFTQVKERTRSITFFSSLSLSLYFSMRMFIF